MPTHAVVLSDTHIRRGGKRRLPDAAYAHLDAADVILHAGDIVVGEVLDELRGFAPVHAVLGNNDAELVGLLPQTQSLMLDGVRIAMIHDSGPSAGRAGRMRRRFPDADVVVFGHSHIPWDDAGVDGQLLFNPGSPTERRSQPHHTLGTLDLDRGQVVSAVHVLA
ncbi:MAG: metallophosphatase family protein [Actinomycetota bacterium]|nr:metallophosphatase family protein [Actinomycetota bacterium]